MKGACVLESACCGRPSWFIQVHFFPFLLLLVWVSAHAEMADQLIEQASQALSQVWISHGQLNAGAPQIVEQFSRLERRIVHVEESMEETRKQSQAQERNLVQLLQDFSRVSSSVNSLVQRVEGLDREDSGLVTHSGLRYFFNSSPELQAIKIMQTQMKELHERIQDIVPELQSKVTSSERDMKQHFSRLVLDEARAHKENYSKVEEQMKEQLRDLAAKWQSSRQESQKVKEELSDHLSSLSKQLGERLSDARRESESQLQAALRVIVESMKQQADVIDELKKEKELRAAQAPDADKILELQADMESMRRDLDRAQFRIHEAYSNCISMAKSLAVGEVNAALKGPKPAAITTEADGGDASIDVRMSVLQREVTKIVSTSIPHLSAVVAGHKEKIEALMDSTVRANLLFKNCMAILGLRDRGDELQNAVELGDSQRVLLILRRCFEVIDTRGRTTGESAQTPSVSVNAGVGQAGSSLSVNSITGSSLSTLRPMTLGVEVADKYVVTGKGGRPVGAEVMAVTPESIAGAAGLRVGEYIVDVNGVSVDGVQAFLHAMRIAEATVKAEILKERRRIIGGGGEISSESFMEPRFKIALTVVGAGQVSRVVHIPVG
jgi:predicted transcriptional regulator